MIDQEFITRARLDFIRNFGDSEDIKDSVVQMGAEEHIVIENESRRAFYTQTVELVKVINLQGEEDNGF